ncbi:MAG TPA: HAMP domain-containing sensor histidine kinase [Verrucomicrobiae bacterium]|nr:HAMP domain-containing sensor histidine kinase [Verrucomicrobiae bacterium]
MLTIVLGVAVAGVAFGNRSFLLTGLVSIFAYVAIGTLQVSGVYTPVTYWKATQYSYSDIITYAITMAIIFAVTWLFNRQLHSSYLRVKSSEAALRRQGEHLEELVEERTQALRQEHFQRMADLHTFVLYGKEATGLLHDILSPLTALGLQLESLKRQKVESEQVKNAEATLKRLEQLVTGARRHMRREIAPEDFTLEREVDAVIQSLRHRTDRHGIVISMEGLGVVLHTDPIVIYKILQNIISNAVDASLDVPDKRRHILAKATASKEFLTVQIQDRGVGIPDQAISQVFEPYYTTKKQTEGSGIGLSLVRELVEQQLMGTISLESSQEGTLVTLQLPNHILAESYAAKASRKTPKH